MKKIRSWLEIVAFSSTISLLVNAEFNQVKINCHPCKNEAETKKVYTGNEVLVNNNIDAGLQALLKPGLIFISY